MTPLRMAVVGTGALGRHHARILSGLEGVQLAAVVDVDPEAGQRVAQSCGADWVDDHSIILDQIDAAVVAVPTQAHLKVAGDFISHGVDVLVEKPIAASLAEAEQLVDLADSHNVILQVGHIERYNPAYVAARGHVAEPRYVRAERFSPYAFRSTDIGVVHDVMIHDIDLVLSLVRSPVERVEAFGISIMGTHEDCAQARVHFADGCIADFSANRVSPVTRRDMQVWSPDGCLYLDFAARELTVYSPSPALLYGTPPLDRARQPGANLEQLRAEVFGTFIKVHKPAVAPRDQLTEELLAFVDCVQTRKTPLVDGRQALAAMQLADQILRDLAAHEWNHSADGLVGPHLRSVAQHKRAG